MKKKFKYPALVIQEAENLRKLATREEKNNLDLLHLNPKNEFRCIYGQMTGSCFSDRAEELIVKSCQRVYKYDKKQSDDLDSDCLSKKLNGKPQIGGRYKNTDYSKEERGSIKFGETFFSPIEVFIFPDKNKEATERLVKYIKGEIRVL